MLACIKGNIDLVKLFHQNGASCVERNDDRLTPLLLAIYYKHYFVVHFLMSVEEVIDQIMKSVELLKVLKFAIFANSFQIFELVQKFMDDTIQALKDKDISIW